MDYMDIDINDKKKFSKGDDDDHDTSDEISDTESITSTNDEVQNVYQENCWPAKPEMPKGYTFKGKNKMMTYSMNKIKSLLKKGSERQIDDTIFKILDVKIHGGATQILAQMTDSAERGNAVADLWGPNKRKECTILIKKIKRT